MGAFMIANISGIAFTVSFLSQNLTLSLIGIPAMLNQRPGAVTGGKEQALILVHQWHKIYDRGHIMGPRAALMATLSFIYALQSTGNSSEAHRTLLITAASFPILIFPYTYVFLHRINQELFWRAGTLKQSPPEPNLSEKLSTAELYVVVAGVFVVIWLVNFIPNKDPLSHVPTHTFTEDNSRKRYLTDLKSLLELGYRLYNNKGQPFKVKIPVGGYTVKYRVVLPKDHLEEIKHQSNAIFSWQLASAVIFAQDFTGAPDRGAWSGKALRVGIHQNLKATTEQLQKRITDYFSANLPQKQGEVATVDLMSFFVPAITYVTNALLVDERLSSDPEWLKQTADFAVNRYGAAEEGRQWPPYLAGLVAPMIPSVKRLRQQRKYVLEKMKPIYDDLKSQGLINKKGRKHGAFGYEWLWSGSPDDVTLQDFSDTMMRTLIAAIHTTAKTISVALVDLLTRPEFVEELKAEAREAVGPDNHVDLERLVKLDCFLKESQRLSPVFLFTMNRIVTEDYEFKCSGLKLPKGTMIMAPAAAIATDPETFRDPNTFDGHRYYRMRQDRKEAASSLVLGMSTIDSLGFGLGSQACPGRFLAVNNLKLLLSKLLHGWDLAIIKDGKEYAGPSPKMEYNDFSVVPPKEFTMRLRKL